MKPRQNLSTKKKRICQNLLPKKEKKICLKIFLPQILLSDNAGIIQWLRHAAFTQMHAAVTKQKNKKKNLVIVHNIYIKKI